MPKTTLDLLRDAERHKIAVRLAKRDKGYGVFFDWSAFMEAGQLLAEKMISDPVAASRSFAYIFLSIVVLAHRERTRSWSE